MPEVQYKTAKGTQKKKVPYTKKGVAQAKKVAQETGGKIKMNRKSYS